MDHLPHILPHELNQRHISGPVIIEAVSRIAPPELLRTVQQHDTRPLRDKPVEGFAHLRISGVGIDDQCVQPPGQQMLKALLLRDDLRKGTNVIRISIKGYLKENGFTNVRVFGKK